MAERQFLAEVEHPHIVKIYNFVTRGRRLHRHGVRRRQVAKEMLKARMRRPTAAYDPLPLDQALAFLLEIMPAFDYLHDLSLIYCDFKPDNIIQSGDPVKLIDLGGVRVDDMDAAIYGPGLSGARDSRGRAVGRSDIYTIGRTLTVLTTEFRGTRAVQGHPAPGRADPGVQANDSFYRLLLKAAPRTQPTASCPPMSCACSCSAYSVRWWRRIAMPPSTLRPR